MDESVPIVLSRLRRLIILYRVTKAALTACGISCRVALTVTTVKAASRYERGQLVVVHYE